MCGPAGREPDVRFADTVSVLLPDQHQGGTAAEADQLVPEVEEALLQTKGANSLLCQRCQGELSSSNQRNGN